MARRQASRALLGPALQAWLCRSQRRMPMAPARRQIPAQLRRLPGGPWDRGRPCLHSLLHQLWSICLSSDRADAQPLQPPWHQCVVAGVDMVLSVPTLTARRWMLDLGVSTDIVGLIIAADQAVNDLKISIGDSDSALANAACQTGVQLVANATSAQVCPPRHSFPQLLPVCHVQ